MHIPISLPRDGALSTHINGDYDHVARYETNWHKHPKFNIFVKQDLPLPDSRIGAFEQPLFSAIIYDMSFYFTNMIKIKLLNVMQSIASIYNPIDN